MEAKRMSKTVLPDFPVITSGDWHTQNGMIFKLCEDGKYKQIEAYLAAVPTQYGCKTYAEQFERLQRVLGDRLHPLRSCDTSFKWVMGDSGTLTRADRVKRSES